MILLKLEVFNKLTKEIIRSIDFNRSGLSLIVDEDSDGNSGSSIGKTTTVKIIDLCLGGKSTKSIYYEKDTGYNEAVKEFIILNKISSRLYVEIDDEINIFSRDLFPRGKCFINGDEISNADIFREELNKIVFENYDNMPSFRQLISKFVRLDNSNEDSLLKFLSHGTNEQYQAIYKYLYDIDDVQSKNMKNITENKKIDNEVSIILKKNEVKSLNEINNKFSFLEKKVNSFKENYEATTVIEDYGNKEQDFLLLKNELNITEIELDELIFKNKLLKENIVSEKEKIEELDERALNLLYDETLKIFGNNDSLKELEELKKFHNGMIEKRLEILERTLNEQENSIFIYTQNRNRLRKKFETEFVDFNTTLRNSFEENYEEYLIGKGSLSSLDEDIKYIQKLLNNKIEILDNSNDLTDRVIFIQDTLNNHFSYYTEKIIGETYFITFEKTGFPISITGIKGKPGTGIKKALIACFDLAHINLIIELNLGMPRFVIHDKMENITLLELKSIINEAHDFNGQYIFPILSDRITEVGVNEQDVILTLSKNNRFFKI